MVENTSTVCVDLLALVIPPDRTRSEGVFRGAVSDHLRGSQQEGTHAKIGGRFGTYVVMLIGPLSNGLNIAYPSILL